MRRGYGNQPRELTVEELAHLEAYTPRFVPVDQWEPVRDFVLDIVREAAPYSRQHPRNYMSHLVRYAAWCNTVMGVALDRVEVLDRDLIAYYAMNALTDHARGSRGTARARLLWYADHVLPAGAKVQRLERVGRNPATVPYSPAEVAQMKRWASAQPTAYKRHACWTVLTFGLGAGLTPTELDQVRREHVVEDEHGVTVEVVAGPKPRKVPVRGEWEDHAVVLAEAVESGAFVFKAERTKPQPAHIGWTIGHSKNRPDFGVNLQRMRLSWYVDVLNSGCPVTVLVEAAGLEGLAAVERVLPFLDPVPADVAHEHLRAWHSERKARYRDENREYLTALEQQRRARDREAFARQVRE